MKEKRKRLIILHHLPGMTRRMIRDLFKIDESLTFMFTANPYLISRELNIPLKKATDMYKAIRDDSLIALYEKHLRQIKVITIYDKLFPPLLRHIYDPPYVLYCLGNLSLLQSNQAISVIGTRTPSKMGLKKVHFIVSPLIQKNWTIVSGLAYGIDRYAHEVTLKNQGNTIAILGSGFHHLYPKEHASLFEEIVERGLVITEYPPHIKPRRYHFPERNRLISGISKAVLVIEAKERSGTYLTVDFALEQGKDVYVVPGSIFSPESRGCHKMIQEGAKLIMSTEDILEDFP